jgi:hypothetical protein
MVMHTGDTIKRDRLGSSPEILTLQGAIATSQTEVAAPLSPRCTPSSTAVQTQTLVRKLHKQYPENTGMSAANRDLGRLPHDVHR